MQVIKLREDLKLVFNFIWILLLLSGIRKDRLLSNPLLLALNLLHYEWHPNWSFLWDTSFVWWESQLKVRHMFSVIMKLFTRIHQLHIQLWRRNIILSAFIESENALLQEFKLFTRLTVLLTYLIFWLNRYLRFWERNWDPSSCTLKTNIVIRIIEIEI